MVSLGLTDTMGPIDHRPIDHRPIDHRLIDQRSIDHRPIERVSQAHVPKLPPCCPTDAPMMFLVLTDTTGWDMPPHRPIEHVRQAHAPLLPHGAPLTPYGAPLMPHDIPGAHRYNGLGCVAP